MVVKRNRLLGIGMIIACISFSIFAWNYIPTFRQRIGYVQYTYEMYKGGNRTGDYSDLGRVISYKIAIRLIKEHPIAGVGAGDILDEMKKGYDKWYPDIKDEQRLYPHNEFLTSGLGSGILSMLIFAILALYPLFRIKKGRKGFFTFAAAFVLLIPLMVEPFLEIQFGVFVYLFFLLWIWKIDIVPANEHKN